MATAGEKASLTGDANAAPQRVIGLDVARGALMAYVVIIIHGLFWLRLAPWDRASLILFEMPAIFMIAGAAFSLAERSGSEGGYLNYLMRRTIRVLVPYFAYALFCALIMIVVRGDTGGEALDTLVAWLNPANGGAGRAAPMLNWHLWFVAPFLVVVALMPLMARLSRRVDAPLWLLAAGATLVAHGADVLDASRIGSIQTIVFYAIWAALGLVLAANTNRYGIRDLAAVMVLSAATLAGLFWAFPGQFTFNMQTNKFPPNAIFFLFCSTWVSFILIAVRWMDKAIVEAAAKSPLLRPFMQGGYSIYLWQGMGYWAAAQIGRQLDWSNFAIWPLAIVLSVGFGMAATPLERIRLPKPQRPAPRV